MADTIHQTRRREAPMAAPPNLVEAQNRGNALMARVNEVIASTARAVWESEMELFHVESEYAAKSFLPIKPGDDPFAAISAYCDQWQEGSEKLLTHMRTVNDLVRKCGWDLIHIGQESLYEATRPFQQRSR